MTSTHVTITASSLGSKGFRAAYGLKYAYLAGAMYRGIASKELVVRMAKANLLAYLGTAGLPLSQIESSIRFIQQELRGTGAYGMNLLADLENPQMETETVALYLRHGVRHIEAAAYMQMTSALVWFRLKGLRANANGRVVCDHHILGKVSRPEVAALFMSPAPESIVQQLLGEGKVSAEQAEWAKHVPMCAAICVEADSGGHTDMGIPTVIFPPLLQLRNQMARRFAEEFPIYMGLAGGIGSPEAAAAAFVMGADFVLTGSINQCTVEGGTSDAVKNLLQEINVQDTDYAPAGDMFELGAKVQVLKRGVFFPARANKLYALYQQYGSLAEIPESVQKQLQERYFKRTFEQIWSDIKIYLTRTGRHQEIQNTEVRPKQKMARIFKWYFAHTTHLALSGDEENRVDFQVHTGPALGAFNQWLKGTDLESWRARHVDDIAERLMSATANLLQQAYLRLQVAHP
jgi:trans-AT polyketide synthase/acyltransferase/oxidoreductase domain-containing protein